MMIEKKLKSVTIIRIDDIWYKRKGFIVESYRIADLYFTDGNTFPTVIYHDSEGKEYKTNSKSFEADFSLSRTSELRSLLFDLEEAGMKILVELNELDLRYIMTNGKPKE